MTLRERRVLFSRLISELVLWIRAQGWEVAYDEVKILTPRAARQGLKRIIVDDAVHRKNSFHYRGLAADLVLYVDLDHDGASDDYVADGNHPAWKMIIDHWLSMHALCTNGTAWGDANHFSLGEGL
jgi:hypothetical protein